MSVMDARAFAFETKSLATSVSEAGLIARDDEDSNKRAWDKLIDDQLIPWGRDPSQLEDDGLEPPSQALISKAAQLAVALRNQGFPPMIVAPNGEGGISFEQRNALTTTLLDLRKDGSLEIINFENHCVVNRQVLG
jgi:hypothetical protein